MFVIAHHFINDPDSFWASAPQLKAAIPAHIKLLSVFPSKDLKTGTCVWEAPNAEEVQNLVDGVIGKMSKNVCYEVNEEMAIGLPQKTLEKEMS
jgi:hypothetical protein